MTTSVAKERASFGDVKRSLYEKNVKFSLLFPARLRVDHGGVRRIFDCPMEAQKFYDLHLSDRPTGA